MQFPKGSRIRAEDEPNPVVPSQRPYEYGFERLARESLRLARGPLILPLQMHTLVCPDSRL